jgi:hypothetical protein
MGDSIRLTSPGTWTSAQVDNAIQTLKARGAAQTQTDAIRLEALEQIKSINEEYDALGPPTGDKFDNAKREDLKLQLAHFNEQYEHADEIVTGWYNFSS